MIKEFKCFCDFLEKAKTIVDKSIRIELPIKIENTEFQDKDNFVIVDNKRLHAKFTRDNKWDEWTQAMQLFLRNVKKIIEINSKHDAEAEKEYLRRIWFKHFDWLI